MAAPDRPGRSAEKFIRDMLKDIKASDVMTRKVVAVRPDTSAREIAALLLKHNISAVPVVDGTGAPVGMVSEGNLLPRDETVQEATRDWWLRLLAEGEELSPYFLSYVEQRRQTARQIMASPVITVPQTADIVEVAEVLVTNRIKRVPVLAEGVIVGIISRADLVKAVAFPVTPAESEPTLGHPELVFPSERPESGRPLSKATAPQRPEGSDMSAEGFRTFVQRHEDEETVHRKEAHRLALDKRHHEVSEMLAADLTEAKWQHMLHDARMSASKGEKEHLLLQFPCELCTDHGRAVNVPDPSWPATLRGLPAQVFMRWKQELRDRGFKLRARVIDFPGGVPGNIGLFLVWGG
jgi:CBS domain-containing protein